MAISLPFLELTIEIETFVRVIKLSVYCGLELYNGIAISSSNI